MPLQRSQTPKGLEGSTSDDASVGDRTLQRSQTPKGLEGLPNGVNDRQHVRRFNEAKPRRVWKVGDCQRTKRRIRRASTKPNPEGFGRADAANRRYTDNSASTKPNPEGFGRLRCVLTIGRSAIERFNEAKPRRVWKATATTPTIGPTSDASTKPNPEGFGRTGNDQPRLRTERCFNEAKPRRVWKGGDRVISSRSVDRASTKPNPEGFGRVARLDGRRSRVPASTKPNPEGFGRIASRRPTSGRRFNEAKPRRVWKASASPS